MACFLSSNFHRIPFNQKGKRGGDERGRKKLKLPRATSWAVYSFVTQSPDTQDIAISLVLEQPTVKASLLCHWNCQPRKRNRVPSAFTFSSLRLSTFAATKRWRKAPKGSPTKQSARVIKRACERWFGQNHFSTCRIVNRSRYPRFGESIFYIRFERWNCFQWTKLLRNSRGHPAYGKLNSFTRKLIVTRFYLNKYYKSRMISRNEEANNSNLVFIQAKSIFFTGHESLSFVDRHEQNLFFSEDTFYKLSPLFTIREGGPAFHDVRWLKSNDCVKFRVLAVLIGYKLKPNDGTGR